jgi:hypothetical protein
MKAAAVLLAMLLLAAAFALATVAFGWWAVPVVAALWALIARRQRGGAAIAGIAAMVGWGALLAIDASRGPLGALAQTLGTLFSMKAIGVYAITLALPGLLAVTAAVVARAAAVSAAGTRR